MEYIAYTMITETKTRKTLKTLFLLVTGSRVIKEQKKVINLNIIINTCILIGLLLQSWGA